eukprot:jgi/Botrbrau1/7211/Bobra.0300s0036.1
MDGGSTWTTTELRKPLTKNEMLQQVELLSSMIREGHEIGQSQVQETCRSDKEATKSSARFSTTLVACLQESLRGHLHLRSHESEHAPTKNSCCSYCDYSYEHKCGCPLKRLPL